MSAPETIPLPVEHRFVDEMGDTTFYGKGKEIILGKEGVSLAFGLGIVKFTRPLHQVRKEIRALQAQVENDDLLNTIPSVAKRIARGGFFFHACKDSDDVRSVFLRYLRNLECEAEFQVARKIPSLFLRKHNGKDDEFYADVLSHLLKGRLKQARRMVLNIAERGSSTRARILETALVKATCRAHKRWSPNDLKTELVFNVQSPSREPLLAVPDYLGWAIQRVFERGQTRYYDYLRERIRLVVDLYDIAGYAGSTNYYDNRRNPLTARNKIDPQTT
jgi:hypothetical protein